MKAYIGGTFDLLHPGHISLFKRAKFKYGYLIVSLNTDEFAERYKRKPVMSIGERFEMVDACRYVDKVVINLGNEDSTQAILLAQPDIILHGDDWTGPDLMKQMGLTQEFLDKHGIRLEYMAYTKGISTSDILCRKSLFLPQASGQKG